MPKTFYITDPHNNNKLLGYTGSRDTTCYNSKRHYLHNNFDSNKLYE